ncbi:hypothetical protein GGR56DRAFT_429377 [Xylariaceae sp. FL0804]|nr:hypothetical protein GGR56DRAFT_429377 [Xylariaceae sp. FL0804]
MVEAATTEPQQVVVLLALSTVITAISFILIVTRCIVRFVFISDPGMDDYMIIGALMGTGGFLATLYLGADEGLGHPMETLSLYQMEYILKLTWAIELLYYTVIVLIKCSIVFMYNRFAISENFRRLCLGTNILLGVFYIICVGTVVGQCRPLEKFWNVAEIVPGSCINTTAFFYFTSGFNIVTDCWILILPIRTLRKLQISRNRLRMLYGVFGVGAIATAMSCVRLSSIYTYTLATDPFKDGVLINLWSMIEINVAIWCASAPALKPIFTPRRLLEARRERTGYKHHQPSDEPSSVFSKNPLDGRSSSTSQNPIATVVTRSESHGAGSSRGTRSIDEFELAQPKRASKYGSEDEELGGYE